MKFPSCLNLSRYLLPVLFLLALSTGILPAKEVPSLAGRVNDHAGMLSPGTVRQLESSLGVFETQESTQIVILTISSLEGEALEEYSLRVAEQWQIGQKGLDNGALLLIAKNDRKLRIEVGYGLEGKLTDLVAGRIIRDIITPRFKSGNFDQGVIDGATAMMAAVRGEFSAETIPAVTSDSATDTEGLLTMLLFGLFFVGKILGRNKVLAVAAGGVLAPLLGFLFLGPNWLVILMLIPIGAIAGFIASAFARVAPSSRRSGSTGMHWGTGGGFGGSSGGFSGGGGGFGGGGASGGW